MGAKKSRVMDDRISLTRPRQFQLQGDALCLQTCSVCSGKPPLRQNYQHCLIDPYLSVTMPLYKIACVQISIILRRLLLLLSDRWHWQGKHFQDQEPPGNGRVSSSRLLFTTQNNQWRQPAVTEPG
ncbi:hypothetical protein PoB_007079000 [Plakobranchus ocellatus]|uniref:Uncharacterized protein n=1 Tax=Plakobranchus ocellatus TaxID=259542 RepID=A0AAV4DJX7_9GAST|nr:hypothetical protein PoB_007079000 [Plakobranchus ocellatus]